MTPVAFGLSLDHASPRRYVGTRASERPRRAMSDRITLLRRSRATLHRKHWWITESRPRRYLPRPAQTPPSTPQEAA